MIRSRVLIRRWKGFSLRSRFMCTKKSKPSSTTPQSPGIMDQASVMERSLMKTLRVRSQNRAKARAEIFELELELCLSGKTTGLFHEFLPSGLPEAHSAPRRGHRVVTVMPISSAGGMGESRCLILQIDVRGEARYSRDCICAKNNGRGKPSARYLPCSCGEDT